LSKLLDEYKVYHFIDSAISESIRKSAYLCIDNKLFNSSANFMYDSIKIAIWFSIKISIDDNIE